MIIVVRTIGQDAIPARGRRADARSWPLRLRHLSRWVAFEPACRDTPEVRSRRREVGRLRHRAPRRPDLTTIGVTA